MAVRPVNIAACPGQPPQGILRRVPVGIVRTDGKNHGPRTGLRQKRVAGRGCSAVMPGDTRTGFTDARARSFAGDDAYGGRISRSVAKMEKDERGGVSASVVGAALGRAALSKSRKVFCTVGFVYRLVIFLMRLLPSTAANAILGKMYAE